MSIEYYNNQSEKFIKDTFTADMSSLQTIFLSYLSKNDKILDIGCGSGRDSKFFLESGYDVYAHDGSQEMVTHARRFLGNRIALAKFKDFNPSVLFGHDIVFDGMWAIASLLHVEETEMQNVINNYLKYLKNSGIMLISYKKRDKNHTKDERIFTNYTKPKLLKMLNEIDNINIEKIIETNDVRKNRLNEGWISVILRKD